MSRIKLISSDLNGTLVHQHTMSDMIRLYLGDETFRQADSVFKRQTDGTISMEDAFVIAGPLTGGLTLRQAIDYTRTNMKYVNGFHEFIDSLQKTGIPLIINSTGYSVTIYAIRAQLGKNRIQGQIVNLLKFGIDGDVNSTLREDELEELVTKYFTNPESQKSDAYDRIRATGIVDLGIKDEAAKATLLIEYAAKHWPNLRPDRLAHIGDTMGDSGGIYGIAKAGGLGIAFNYNEPLERFLKEKLASEKIPGRIIFVDRKSQDANIMNVLQHLFQ